MRALTTRIVPGISSAGRVRRVPCRSMYSIVPCRPCASHAASRCSSVGQVDARNADLLEAEFAAPFLDRQRERLDGLHGTGRHGPGEEAGSIIGQMHPLPAGLYLRRRSARARPSSHRALRPAGVRTHDSRGSRDAQRAAPALARCALTRGAVRAGQQWRRRLRGCAHRPCAGAQRFTSLRLRIPPACRETRGARMTNSSRRAGSSRRGSRRWFAPATSSSMRSSARDSRVT